MIERCKWWLPGDDEPGSWQQSWTWSGVWRSSGCFSVGRHTADPGEQNCYDNILISRKEGIPDPPNCSVTFRFATSDNGTDWSAWTNDITDCADSRYIKVEVTLVRDDLISAMPTVEDMTVGYFLKG